jgi:hypothetical protein
MSKYCHLKRLPTTFRAVNILDKDIYFLIKQERKL